MLLTIDIGNTMVGFGIFENEKLTHSFATESHTSKSSDEYEAALKLLFSSNQLVFSMVDKVCISSVVPPLLRIFAPLCEKLFNLRPLVLGPGLKTGLPIKTDNPSEVGADLIADAVGGVALYGKDLFIADLGTANKFLYIDERGAFSGCAIAPGLMISMNALVNGTSALPEVSMDAPKSSIGKNTKDSMNSGIIYGTAFEILGFAERFEKELGKPLTKILTGGNAIYVKALLKDFHYEKDLLHEGLKTIARRNEK
ncbi:MAG: type III pantothenate kinase [Bacilli bacterium]|nr:type III pantothenate kinase [Bacilli bacterium]